MKKYVKPESSKTGNPSLIPAIAAIAPAVGIVAGYKVAKKALESHNVDGAFIKRLAPIA